MRLLSFPRELGMPGAPGWTGFKEQLAKKIRKMRHATV